jgi:predicted secreted hydrolase
MSGADRPAWPNRGNSGHGARRLAVRALLRLAVVVVAAVAAVGCSGPILANPPPSHHRDTSSSAPSPTGRDPQPIVFPRDDGPHDRLTEWWYYTGHLVDAAGGRYGFEYVIFRAERGGFPVSWASHIALTDEGGRAFHYAQRSEMGAQVDVAPILSSGPNAFALAVSGTGPTRPTAGATAWTMRGIDGADRVAAALSPAEAAAAGVPDGLALDLNLTATKPPALHDGDGWIDFGAAGGSYYYSRTAMRAAGQLALGGRTFAVTGSAWFDHQWGDFISVGSGGWDWLAVNLSDGTDLTLSLVRAADGTFPLVYGTIVDPDGRARHLDRAAFTVRSTGEWTSAWTGVTYPAGWAVELPGEGLRMELTPTVPDQELDTRSSTGVVYWEGSQSVQATRNGVPLRGEAYVELTGYGAADTAGYGAAGTSTPWAAANSTIAARSAGRLERTTTIRRPEVR